MVELLLQTSKAAAVAHAVGGQDMVAPDLLNAELLSVLRWLEQRGVLDSTRAAQAVADLTRAPLRRLPTLPLLADVWALRSNATPYDACYVVLARALGSPLLTADARLSHAPGLGVSLITV